MTPPLPPGDSLSFGPAPATRRTWRAYAAAAVAIAVVAGGLAYVFWPSSQNWYATGKNLELAAEQHDPGLLVGPVSLLTKACTADLSAATSGQRPAATDKSAASQWMQGCQAGYHQDHPGQVIQDGTMYGKGAKACTGACSSKWHAAGNSIAAAATGQPGLAPYVGTPASAATGWCALLTGNRLSQPLSASVESELKANAPAYGPETVYWDQGCAAGYLTALNTHPAKGPVTVTGAYGTAPDVTIPARLASSSFYTGTLIQGGGARMTSADGAIGNYVAYDWSSTTHKQLGSSYSQGTPAMFVGQLLPGLAKALVGQRAGSRVLAVIPPADGFGSSGNSQEGVGPNDTLVFVIDMISTFGSASVPGTQASDGGGSLPTVSPPAAGSPTGPTITIPSGTTPPGTLQVRTLIKGTGPVVRSGQEIATQYTGVIWRTGEVFGSSWPSKAPLTTVIGAGQVIKGWDVGLVGQTVGSRVMLVVPPADGYGSAGSAQAGINGTDTLAFVVDILAAA
ncbi:MAG TPA: FKBP-type peptidyl-prolyl cis-trans isomerase [Trebonia sp.]|jgi:peptidylprolyl isomerase|nr:FKBP-type peptidyl-prolyl cis-trans isomerase [Trebonia sp.]